jgi:hypothetical protein
MKEHDIVFDIRYKKFAKVRGVYNEIVKVYTLRDDGYLARGAPRYIFKNETILVDPDTPENRLLIQLKYG